MKSVRKEFIFLKYSEKEDYFRNLKRISDYLQITYRTFKNLVHQEMSSRNLTAKDEINYETKAESNQKINRKSEFQSPKPISKNKPLLSLSHELDPNARRSQRAIKRKKFDDEIVDTAPVVAPPGTFDRKMLPLLSTVAYKYCLSSV